MYFTFVVEKGLVTGPCYRKYFFTSSDVMAGSRGGGRRNLATS